MMHTDSLKPDSFETDDIYLSAYLSLAGATFIGKRKQGNTKVYFIFENKAGSIRDLRTAYFAGTAYVKPHEYKEKIIAYKEMIFDV